MEFKEAPYIDPPAEWLAAFEAVCIKAGMTPEQAKSYTNGGGWGDHYAEGMTPEQALEEDQQYWESDEPEDFVDTAPSSVNVDQ